MSKANGCPKNQKTVGRKSLKMKAFIGVEVGKKNFKPTPSGVIFARIQKKIQADELTRISR